MPHEALGQVMLEGCPGLQVLEAELAEEQLWQLGVLLGVGRRVPRVDLVLAELDRQGRTFAGTYEKMGYVFIDGAGVASGKQISNYMTILATKNDL